MPAECDPRLCPCPSLTMDYARWKVVDGKKPAPLQTFQCLAAQVCYTMPDESSTPDTAFAPWLCRAFEVATVFLLLSAPSIFSVGYKIHQIYKAGFDFRVGKTF